MIQLRTLGAVELLDAEGAELHRVLAQPKRLALLAYLAIAGSTGYVRRDTMLAVFWPESDEERARGAFRQAVRYLRRGLGDDVIVNRGSDEVAVADGALHCDAVAFRKAVASGDHAMALDLYRGDLLEGFFIPDAPGFDQWLENERLSMRQAAAAAAVALADQCEAVGELTEAASRARRALDLAPYDESIARRLILILDRSGDRASAVTTFEQFAQALERDLDLQPSPETLALVTAVRDRTESALDPASLQLPDPDLLLTIGDGLDRPQAPQGDPRPPAQIISAPSDPAWRRRLILPITLGVVAIAALSLYLLTSMRSGTDAMPAQPIMVVPFENQTGDDALDPLSAMAADWITQGIAHTGAFEVVPARAVLVASRYVDQDAHEGPARLSALIRETRAQSLVTGAYYRTRDSLFFHAQVTRARTGAVLAVIDRIGVPASAPLDGVDLVRRRVLAAMAPLDETATHARVAATPPSYEAYQTYVTGMEAFVRFDFETALHHFRRSAESDASYPLPLIAASIAHLNLGQMATADSLTRRVEELRDQLGALEASTLDMVQAWLRGDNHAAYEAVVRQARIAPGTIGHYQVAEQARRLNRPRETIRVLQELGPERGELRGWVPYWRELTAARHMLGHHRRELSAARRARKIYPNNPGVMHLEARALAALGRLSEIDAIVDARGASPSRGQPSAGALMSFITVELQRHGHLAASELMSQRAITWFVDRLEGDTPSPEHQRELAFAMYLGGQLAEAESLYRDLASAGDESLSTIGMLGVLAARRHDFEEASRHALQLDAWPDIYLRHISLLWRARIAAQSGEHDRAVALLQEATGVGLQFGPWLHADPDLEPLRDHPRFRELMRPKG